MRSNLLFRYFMLNAIFASILAVFLIPLVYAGGIGYTPTWQTGDSWRIKAVYPLHNSNDEKWSLPVFWDYQVEDALQCEGQECMKVTVKGDKNALNLSAILFFRKDDLSLMKVILQSIRRQRPITQVLHFEIDTPVITERTLIPFDIPVFPILESTETDFKISRSLGSDMKTVEKIKQSVTLVKNIPETTAKSPNDIFRVSCRKENGLTGFVQYWEKGLPWASYGENPNMKYWLMVK